MSPRGPQPIAGAVQDVGNSTTLSRYAGVRAEGCQRMTEDAEQFTMCTRMIRTKRRQQRSLME